MPLLDFVHDESVIEAQARMRALVKEQRQRAAIERQREREYSDQRWRALVQKVNERFDPVIGEGDPDFNWTFAGPGRIGVSDELRVRMGSSTHAPKSVPYGAPGDEDNDPPDWDEPYDDPREDHEDGGADEDVDPPIGDEPEPREREEESNG